MFDAIVFEHFYKKLVKYMFNSEKNLFSIGEIAKILKITRRIILNYEDKGLIKPDIKDGKNGNRYYTIDSLVKLKTIRSFQNLGLSLNEIKTYMEGKNNLPSIIKRFKELRDEIDLAIEKLTELENNSFDIVKSIVLKEQTVYFKKTSAKSIKEKTDALRDTALCAMQKYGTDMAKQMYFTQYPIYDPENITYCAVIPKKSSGENVTVLKETPAICIYHRGAYEDIYKVREKLISYANKNGLKTLGICRHTYLEGAPQHKDKNRFVTQVALLIEK